jgi:hypothetical protein
VPSNISLESPGDARPRDHPVSNEELERAVPWLRIRSSIGIFCTLKPWKGQEARLRADTLRVKPKPRMSQRSDGLTLPCHANEARHHGDWSHRDELRPAVIAKNAPAAEFKMMNRTKEHIGKSGTSWDDLGKRPTSGQVWPDVPPIRAGPPPSPLAHDVDRRYLLLARVPLPPILAFSIP